MVPTHDLNECPAKVYVMKEMGDGRKEPEGEKNNPFAALERLKKTK